MLIGTELSVDITEQLLAHERLVAGVGIQDIKEQERRSGRTYVSFANERKLVEPNATTIQQSDPTSRNAGLLAG